MRLFLLLAVLFLSIACSETDKHQKEFFISEHGKDGNKGTKRHPFHSFEEARNAIRNYKGEKQLSQDIIVWIREGVYEFDKCLELTDEDSGNKNCNITYQAYPGENVIIMGAKSIPFNSLSSVPDEEQSRIIDKTARDKIKIADLKSLGLSDYGKLQITGFRRPYVNAPMELFINGKPYYLARYPNQDKIRIFPDDVIEPGTITSPAKIKYNREKLKQWTKAKDIFTCGNYAYAWSTDQLRVKSIDTTSGVVEFADTHMFPVSGSNELNRYFYFNLLEELDSPGEYFIDHENGKLYFYPYQELNPEDNLVVSTLERSMISLKGADYTHFKDIHFDACRGIGIYMEQTEYNTIENCIFRNQGVVAICIGKGSEPYQVYAHPDVETVHTDHPMVSEELGSLHEHMYACSLIDRDAGHYNGIINCVIENTGCGGISLGGGKRAGLTPGENYVYNCEFSNCGRTDYSYKTPINVDGVGNKISHCQFNACPATAVYIHGNNHIIEYNKFVECCNYMDDQGAIYLGRDPSEFGNIIRYNYFENIGIGEHMTMSVYCDDGACGTSIYCNVFYKAGTRTIMIGGGQYNKIENNIFIDSKLAIHLDNRLQNWYKVAVEPGGIFEIRLNEVKYQEPPFSEAYPVLTNYFRENPSIPKHNDIKRNIFVNVEQMHNGKKEWAPVHDENFVTEKNPGFLNISGKDFRLKESSDVFEKLPSFENIPFEKIGRLNN